MVQDSAELRTTLHTRSTMEGEDHPLTIEARAEAEKDAADEDWRHCEAKELLIEDLRSGAIPLDKKEMSIQQAYDSRPEYQATARDQWAERLRRTKIMVGFSLRRAQVDIDFVALEETQFDVKEHDSLGRRRWDGSPAQMLLRQDVEDGYDVLFDAETLYELRDEYEQFDLPTFRKHITQERRRKKRLNDPNYKKKKPLV